MNLRILVPHHVFADRSAVLRILAPTADGALTLLPAGPDRVVALVAGILEVETSDCVVFVQIGGGVLVKMGRAVRISARREAAGDGAGLLCAAVERDFARIHAERRAVRSPVGRQDLRARGAGSAGPSV